MGDISILVYKLRSRLGELLSVLRREDKVHQLDTSALSKVVASQAELKLLHHMADSLCLLHILLVDREQSF